MPYSLKTITPWARYATWAFLLTQVYVLLDSILWRRFLVAFRDWDQSLVKDSFTLEELAAWEESLLTWTLYGFIVILIVWITAYVVNGMWIYRVVSNAHYFDPSRDRVGPGWAIGWHAIPIAHLWMPYRAMKQTWNASQPDALPMKTQVPPFFTVWWIAWITASLLASVTTRWALSEDINDQITSYTADLAIAPLTFVAGVLFLLLIERLSKLQRDKGQAFVPRPYRESEP